MINNLEHQWPMRDAIKQSGNDIFRGFKQSDNPYWVNATALGEAERIIADMAKAGPDKMDRTALVKALIRAFKSGHSKGGK